MLFKLNSIVKFNRAIRPACLPEQLAISAENAIIIGWGSTPEGYQSGASMKARLNFFSQRECKAKYEKNVFLSDGIVEEAHLCAGSYTDKNDTCQGRL